MIVNQHFVPSSGLDFDAYVARGDINGAQHVIRYLWALAALAERPRLTALLDLGCGDGYGCFAIAKRYPQVRVVGIDCDADAIAAGRRSYALPNLELRVGDAVRWDDTLGDDDYDCIVSFDSIEHVEHRELYLEGVVEHLTDSGCLMLSTPCAQPMNILRPEWPAHKVEYSQRSLYDLLARYFRTIRRPDEGSLPQAQVFERLEGTGIPYLMQLNPVLCEGPVRITSPYRPARAQNADPTTIGVTAFAGDWDGSGVDLPGFFDARLGKAALLHVADGAARWEVVQLGVEGVGWHAVAGDWTGRGRDTLGLYNIETGRCLLFERNAAGAVSREMNLDMRGAGWRPVAGKWNGGRADTIGLFDPRTRDWRLGVSGTGACPAPFAFGPAQTGLVPLAGKWTSEGSDSVALYAAGSANFYFKHAAGSGPSDFIVNYGIPGNLTVVGDWDGDGIDTVGACSLADGRFHLRNVNTSGYAHATYEPPADIRPCL